MADLTRYLYRGVNPDLYRSLDGKLRPKREGKRFKSHMYWGNSYWGDASVWGGSERNAVILHQRDSSKYPSSGISTTPVFETAVNYATHNGKYGSGYVYMIDTNLLQTSGVTAYPVDQHAVKPRIPSDQEVILVAGQFGALPEEIIVQVIEV